MMNLHLRRCSPGPGMAGRPPFHRSSLAGRGPWGPERSLEMPRPMLGVVLVCTLVLSLAACAPPAAPAASGPAGAATQATSSTKKILMAGVWSQPAGLFQELTNPTGAPSSVPGLQELYQLVNGTLTYLDPQANRREWL